jgi:group I intron endonuclease
MFIYKVTNRITGKCYIGQTTRNIEIRKIEHARRMKDRSINYFHNALRKYGLKNFKWETLCECSSKEELDDMEFHYIKQYNSYYTNNGYNTTRGGEGRFDFIVSNETREKLSKANKGKKRNEKTKALMRKNQMSIGNSFYGKKHTKESREKMGRKGKLHPSYGKKWPDEVKQKISETIKILWEDKNSKYNTKEYRESISKRMKGRKFGEDTIKKLSKINSGKGNPMYGHKYTKEELENLSKKTWVIENTNGELEYVKVMSIWCKENSVSRSTIRRTQKTNKFCNKGYKIKEIIQK